MGQYTTRGQESHVHCTQLNNEHTVILQLIVDGKLNVIKIQNTIIITTQAHCVPAGENFSLRLVTRVLSVSA